MIGNLENPNVRTYDPPTSVKKLWTGQIVGFVTVFGVYAWGKEGTYWLCQCRCGRFTIKSDRALGRSKQRSCGCTTEAATRKRSVTHGETLGRRHSPEMRSYSNARQRCCNPKNKDFPNYGGRGIEFRFKSFTEFLDCVGIRTPGTCSIERIDVNGHYEPGNVQWASRLEQANNLRRNIRITIDGKTLSISQWARRMGIQKVTIVGRIRNGFCKICAVTLRPNPGERLKCRCSKDTEVSESPQRIKIGQKERIMFGAG